VNAASAIPPPQEPRALVVRHPYLGGRSYALGRHLYRSPDEGNTWINLTGDGLGSIIGNVQTSIAFHPANPDLIVVSNLAGLWRSADGGLSWDSLNDRLPNFPASHFLTGEAPGENLRIQARGLGSFEWMPGPAAAWRLVGDASAADPVSHWESVDHARHSPELLAQSTAVTASFRVWIDGTPVSPDLTRCSFESCPDPERHFITAVAISGGELSEGVLYAGTSDGLLWVSDNSGASWRRADITGGDDRPVTALYVDAGDPLSAIAALEGEEGSRLFRTNNGGRFWDDITVGLPAGRITAVSGTAKGLAVYAAGEFGVFYSRGNWQLPAAGQSWSAITANLPAGRVHDLLLDTVSGFLFASVEGFGVYRLRAPAVLEALRVLNAADLTQRAAAPGGLLTILGADVEGASVSGAQAPLLASSEREAQIQVPFEASGDQLELSLRTRQGRARIGYPLAAVSPAIFVDRGGPLVLDAGTGRLLGPAFPAGASSQVLILATGLGRVNPDWPTGVPAPLSDPPQTVSPVRAYLNGMPLKVLSAALAGGYIGTYVVQAELPAVLEYGAGELALEVGGRLSNTVRIFTQP
jgi:uncharacterized protein (TIGR03437 family)